MPLPIRRLAAPLLLALAALALPTRDVAAQAQASSGVIRGTVRDEAGAPVAGAVVTIKNLETNAERSLTTNAAGSYVAPLLRIGTYDVGARAVGFRPVARKGIVLRLGETSTIDLALAKATVQLEELTTTAGGEPVAEPDRVASATRLDADVVQGLPNNGRNFLNLTTLTPTVAVTQGPDGDVLSIGGQRGIHNNVSVDGADFNNPFFGEQRGGQRPAFTFNLDAVQEVVVVAQGANAEFGRSGGGFVNVITKSGTNTFKGSAHFFGKYDQLSQDFRTNRSLGGPSGFSPDFAQSQFGGTLGGPIVKDKAFFFVAYDQQIFRETKQNTRLPLIDPALVAFTDTAFGRALAGDFGAIRRTNDAQALLAKIDWRLNPRNTFTLKYNYTNSRQQNGTFDVDLWGRSANGLERVYSNAVNGSLQTLLGSSATNEFRFQFAREDRPRTYEGPVNPRTNRPFPDTDISFTGYRIGQPFFLPVQAFDDRFQFLDNLSILKGNHLIKAGVEWNRTRVQQTFQGFANGRIAFTSVNGFLNYNRFGRNYVECSNGTSSTTGACPTGTTITGPVALYLQFAGVGGLSAAEAGTQEIVQNEFAIFLQDSWKPNDKLTVDYGLRWEAQQQPDPITDPSQVFYAPFIGQSVTNSTGTYTFPSDGRIPSDWNMFQPRLGFAYDVKGDTKQVIRGSAGIYYARIPGLNLASSRTTNGSRGQNLFRNSALTGILGAPPAYGELLPNPTGGPFQPDVFVFDQNFRNPRTISATVSYDREVAPGTAISLSYTHARTDGLTRFINRNDAVFGSPWSTGLPGGNGIGTLTSVEATAKSRYNAFNIGARRTLNRKLEFQVNYTLGFDKADDDNERDPFSFRYVRPDRLDREYNWSDRDARHRVNAWFLAVLPGEIYLNNRFTAVSATPISESCGRPGTPARGERATVPSDRICADGSILQRNTLRKNNSIVSWDLRISKPISFGRGQMLEAIVEVFNVLNRDNFRDPSNVGLFLNFDGTIRSGIGEPRQLQTGLRYLF